ncbi:MAG: sigma 54-interacting transcriptional regulator [Thermodesulfobacteriota bacterium]
MLKKLDNAFWETIIDTIQEGLMLVSPDGEILYVNKAFEGLLGYKFAELKGKTCALFECSDCAQARANGLAQFCSLFKKGSWRRKECVFQRKDGESVHLLKSADVIRDEKGEIVVGVETLVDLSQVVAGKKVIDNLRQQLNSTAGFKKFIGNSRIMRRVFDMATSAAHSDAHVLILGESGTGKELMAAAIHEISDRADGPFIKVNCASLNDNLLESELFGHVKGAFTGADGSRVGRFEAANGGSIFLDEIGDIPMTTQTKLLRVLQEKEIEKVGDHRPIKIDARIITATNKDLSRLIAENLFREDLFYRIGVIPIIIPPLRDRSNDIPLLAENFIKRLKKRSKKKKVEGISTEVLETLIQYRWPGNIRELMNAIEYAFALCPGGMIGPQHLPAHFQGQALAVPAAIKQNGNIMEKDQRQQLIEALENSDWNRSRAAEILGVSRVTVWKRMKKYGVQENPR